MNKDTQTSFVFLGFMSVLLAIIFAITSCSPKKDYTFLTINREGLYNLITQTYKIKPLKYHEFSGEIYSIPDIKWINEKYTPFFSDFLFKYNITKYKDFSNDCTKFVSYGLTCGYILFNKEGNAPVDTSLAIGEYSYIHWSMVIHSIIIFAVNDNGQIKLVFYEPQYQKIIELDKEQIEACVDWSI